MIKLKSLLEETNADTNNDVVSFAKSKGYIHKTYRGDVYGGDLYSYTRKERREYGIFTTPIKKIADQYAKGKSRCFYVKAPKILDLMNDSLDNMKWVNAWGEIFDEWRDPQSGKELSAWDVLSGGRLFDYEGNWSSERWMDIQASACSDGYDATILPDYDSNYGIFPSFVVFDENMIKLADEITYDDNNEPIPLELRFNDKSDDIRY